MTYTTESVADLTGRTAVVTGANGGLGLQTATVLAAKGAHVVMAVRDQEKAARAVDEVMAEAPDASVELVALDLASQASVRSAAERIRATHDQVDLLVNNAGLMATPQRRTEDGFELQFGVNHLGHWTLTALLMPAILAAPRARVVTVTSVAMLAGRRVRADDPRQQERYDPWQAYGTSKLANYEFGLGLQRELKRAGAAAISLVAHPGLTHSDLQTRTVREGGAGRSGSFWAVAARYTGMSLEDGAMPQIRAATDPEAAGGDFFGPLFLTRGPAVRVPHPRHPSDEALDSLWAFSERETGVPLRF